MIRAVVACTLAVLLVAAAWSPWLVSVDAVVGTGTGNSCTEAALDAALAAGGNITFNCGSSPVIITVTSQKTIAADTSIDGGGLIVLNASGIPGVFSVNSGTTLALANLTYSGGGGSAILNYGTITVTDSTFVSNSALDDAGGAIANFQGTVNVTRSTFIGWHVSVIELPHR